MTAPAVVTLEDLDRAIEGLDRSMVNPVDRRSGRCVYTSEDNDGRHCIVGQIWADLGLPVPGPGVMMGARSVVEANGTIGRYEPGVLSALMDLQAAADGRATEAVDDGEDRSWASVIQSWPKIRERALAEAGELGERVIG